MQDKRFPTWPGLGLLLGLCGCYTYGYSPYGYPQGTYGPGAYPAAPSGGYIAPSAPYVPSNGGSPTLTPTPGSPSGPAWQPAPGGSPSSNPAPTFNPNSGQSSGGGAVPYPIENENKDFQKNPNTSGLQLSPTIEPVPVGLATPPSSSSGVQLQPIEPAPAYAPNGMTASAGTADSSDPFEPPVTGTSDAGAVSARPVTMSQAQNPNKKPYGYDARNYSWLRGFVDYDPQDNRWVIIYSAAPSSKDRYGGSITLNDHPSFRNITPMTHVLIEGAIDPSSLDQHGKPMYQIQKVTPLRDGN